MWKSVIIVGAGIAGLSAGCYSRENRFVITIFESHTIPGGLCTAWKRKGYTFWEVRRQLHSKLQSCLKTRGEFLDTNLM